MNIPLWNDVAKINIHLVGQLSFHLRNKISLDVLGVSLDHMNRFELNNQLQNEFAKFSKTVKKDFEK